MRVDSRHTLNLELFAPPMALIGRVQPLVVPVAFLSHLQLRTLTECGVRGNRVKHESPALLLLVFPWSTLSLRSFYGFLTPTAPLPP